MKIVKVKAGFGNQMFQYAFAKTVEKVTGEEVKLDLSAYEKPNGDMGRKPLILNFNLSLPIASREEILRLCLFEHERHNFFPKCYQLKIFLERKLNKQFCYECNNGGCTLDDKKNKSFFDGYWQDCSMVDSIMPELDKDFSPVKEISNESKEKLEHISSVNSVFVGVRRGDYINYVYKFGTLGPKYYDNAMKIVADRVENPVFFVFSDEINWVKKNLDFSRYNTVYMTDTVNDFEDHILMTKCKHSIIANSTYHWWGARRNEYPGKIVVAPKTWFVDGTPINLVPERWIKVENA